MARLWDCCPDAGRPEPQEGRDQMSVPRVLHVVGAMNRGGAESMLMTLYRNLDRSIVQFDFLETVTERTHFTDEIESLGGRVVKCEWSQSPDRVLSTFFNLTRLIKDHGPYAAVHSHILFGSGLVLAAAKLAGVQVRIAHSHNTSDGERGLVRRTYEAIGRVLIHLFATSQLACSLDAGMYLFGRQRFLRDGLIVANAVDTGTFFPIPREAQYDVRRSLDVSTGRLWVVAIARLEPVKNHTFLVDVADMLKQRDVDFQLWFVGDGRMRAELEAEVSRRGLREVVRFLGVRTDIARILQGADCLVLPSHFEGLPVVLVEAQSTGLPCLVSDHVTRDADLGGGLMKFLKIDDPSVWADSIEECRKPYIDRETAHQYLQNKGYDVGVGVATLRGLYGV